MPLPVAPIVITAFRVGAIAAAAWYLGRNTKSAPKHVWREAALDDSPEGLEVTTDRGESEANAHSSVRYCRRIRLPNGKGFEVDFCSIARIRFRRL